MMARAGKMARILTLFAIPCLVSCESGPPKLHPDFCAERNRQLTKEERYRSVLLDIVKRSDAYGKKYGPGGVHFLAFRAQQLASNPGETDEDIANNYLSRYPGCCSMAKPAYYTERWPEDMYVDVADVPHGGWVADVYVWRQLPPQKANPPDRFIRAVSACGDKIRYVGGNGGILE